MNRGEVWWTDFHQSVGGEIQKSRPAIIVSVNSSNRALNRIQVVPLTSNIGRVYPSEVVVSVNGKRGKALVDQLTTVSKSLLSNKVGVLLPLELRLVESTIRKQLGL